MSRAPALPTLWQLPWLRVSLIIKRLEARVVRHGSDECDGDLTALLELRATIERSGWFN